MPPKPDPDTQYLEKQDGITDWLGLLFSIFDRNEFEKQARAMRLDTGAAYTSWPQPAWAKDIWTRIDEIQQQKEGRTQAQAFTIFVEGTDGADGKPYLLRPEIAAAYKNNSAVRDTYSAINTACQKAGLSTNLIANALWEGTDFSSTPAPEEFIDQIHELNSTTHNTAASILVARSGGLSRAASGEGENATPAFTGLWEQATAKLKEQDPSAKLNPAIPAHMALLHRTLIERGQGEIAQDYLEANSQSWSSQKRAEARTEMIDAELPTPPLEQGITKTLNEAAQNDPPSTQANSNTIVPTATASP